MRRFLLAAFLLASFTYTFAATTFRPTTYPTGNSPFVTVSADIDRDGHPDIITSDGGGFTTVLMGQPNGTFFNDGNYANDEPVKQLVVGDFNNDGYPDVAALEEHGYQLLLSTHNGGLSEQPVVHFPTGTFGQGIVAVDLNGDHVPDLVFTICPSTGNCALHAQLNDHTAHFTDSESFGLPGRADFGTLLAADFDRDGHDDIGIGVDSTYKIYRSLGNGTFSATPLQSITSPDGKPIFSAVSGDIDTKNGVDLVFAAAPSCFPDCNANPPIYVYLNGGTGHLSLHQTLTSNSDSTNELKLVDLTGDNRLDLLALNGALQGNNGSLSWAKYAGSGSFGSFSTIMQLGMPMHMTTRDLNLDSRHDLVITDAGFSDTGISPGTNVLTNTGSGAYCSPGPNSSVLSVELCFIGHTGDSFTFEALGNSPTGVRRMELWIDGKKVYNSPDDRLKYSKTLASGKHITEIVAVDQFGASTKITNTVTAP